MNIKQLMVTFFIALLAGGEIGARVLTDKFVYSQGEKVVFTFDGKSEGKTIILKYLSKKGEPGSCGDWWRTICLGSSFRIYACSRRCLSKRGGMTNDYQCQPAN